MELPECVLVTRIAEARERCGQWNEEGGKKSGASTVGELMKCRLHLSAPNHPRGLTPDEGSSVSVGIRKYTTSLLPLRTLHYLPCPTYIQYVPYTQHLRRPKDLGFN